MFGRQFWRKSNVLPKVRQVSSNQIPKQTKRYTSSVSGLKNSKPSPCNSRLLKGLNTTAVDANVNFMKQMEKFSILRCSAVGISTISQSVICLSSGDGALESGEDEEEACPVKRQSLMKKKQSY